MQQTQCACRDALGKIKLNLDKTYRCDPGDVGGIEGYDGLSGWPASGRYTSINGQVLPTFNDASVGQIERWRIIHGGVRDTINLEFRKLKAGSRSPQDLRASEHDAFINESCTGESLPQHLIAADGLTTGAVIKTIQTVRQPAYRWDTLMVFPRAGIYCVIDTAAPAAANVNHTVPSRQLLGLVSVVVGRNLPTDITTYITSELATAAAINMPADVRNKVVTDLRRGFKLSSFVPHPDIQDNEVTGTQDLVFNIDINQNPSTFEINGKSFNLNIINCTLTLGGVDKWTLTSNFVSHPFHIHVNPFQVVKILDPNGKDVSGPDVIDDAAGAVDLQYPAKGKYTVVIRTRYQRYIGDYILHCHILDHEDHGMIQIVRVALPEGTDGISQDHKH